MTAEFEQVEDAVADVAEAARGHDIGVGHRRGPEDHDTWEEHEEARRIEPDPERLNAFVASRLSDTTPRSDLPPTA